ncbi:TrwC relaxase protein involved in conjugal DNA transfer (plasmid) [Streptomyces davaonensis JCM 4913]|uniref:TrwC relaxase protein involved in conjugal DNA transfer n=1 Tax=Streptomyces davaonensis (strain DSM 101723 / JCM 4913 / KCC S-0913 / 768) TaxID=1214101 RepID=K4RG68_STRDJ|nr:MobF family relaxase [Streptomyces davaonensis]CCK32908.1 TrwC relaxase protein involved in conjugal DNA transfer [Streptomyces davaonensis JCM 4913]
MVGDGHRAAGTPLRAAQDEAGVPPGVWKGRGLAAVGLTAGDVVTERQAELLLGEGRHPDADRIERELLGEGRSPAKARRATVLGRPIEHNKSPKTEKAKERTPWLAMDLVFRAPSTAHIAWALGDDETRLVLELCQDIARDKTLAWFEDSVAEIRWRSGGKIRKPIKDGLIVAVFRHYESRAAESKPLLHDHAVVSIRVRRPDDKGTWGNLSADSLMTHIVAADTLYLLYFMEEVSARLGWAWEPREVTPGRRPVMEIAGIDQRLIGWQSTRRQQIEDALPVLTAKYEERQGHAPGERAAYALACQAADQTRPPKRTELRSLTELRKRWRASAIRAYGADIVDRLAERARAAAAAVWVRVRPVVDIVLAAVDVVAVVYVMRGAFKRHHLLAEARRHLSYVLRGRPHEPGLDDQIVQAVVDDYTRPVGRGLKMTADLRALYPRDTEDQAVLRPLTRNRFAPQYERARLAADALRVRSQAVRRADRLGSRIRPRAVAVPAASRSRPRPFRSDWKASRLLEQGTDADTVEQTRRTLEAAAAKLQDGVRERALAHGPRQQPALATAPPPHTQQPGAQQPQSRTTGGFA